MILHPQPIGDGALHRRCNKAQGGAAWRLQRRRQQRLCQPQHRPRHRAARRQCYPALSRIMITADCGGSNGPRLWKGELQRLADETGLPLQVCHYPPGTSKWNKIEHRMFCHISRNWRAAPLTSRLTAVELIAHTCPKTGLTIRCERDTNSSPKGIKVSDEKMASLNLKGDDFHPEWSYTISSREQKAER